MHTPDIEQVILFQIDKTSKISKLFTQREFDRLKLGITVEQWIVLRIIHENNGCSQSDLAVKSLRDPASITRTLDLLQKKGLIERQAIEGNRRQYSLKLTTEGSYFIALHQPLVDQHRALSVRGLSEEERHQLFKLLLKIQENLK